jgi:regulator of replication initiation timing
MEDQVSTMTHKITGYLHTIRQLEEENSKIKTENELLNKQIIKYQAICREQTPVVRGKFKSATTSSEAMHMFRGLFKGDFYCLGEVKVDILNVSLQKSHAIENRDVSAKH